MKMASERHEYLLTVTLRNTGPTRITDYRVDVEFPNAFLEPGTSHALEVAERRTATHWLFRKPHHSYSSGPMELYPGDEVTVMTINYIVTTAIYHSEAMKQAVRATVYSSDMAPRTKEVPMTELNNF